MKVVGAFAAAFLLASLAGASAQSNDAVSARLGALEKRLQKLESVEAENRVLRERVRTLELGRVAGDGGSKAETPSVASAPASGSVAQGEAAYQKGDYATALRLWIPAAYQGEARAQFDMGVIHANGRGVLQDYAVAHMWFSLSASRGDTTAAEYRQKLAKDMSPEQIADAQKMAREWTPNRPQAIGRAEPVTDARAPRREQRDSKKVKAQD